ncbi:MAG: tetratricopeptide repeat protein [Bryobacteraceae bacterium]
MILFFLFLLFFQSQPQPSLLQRGLIALKDGQLAEARRDLEQASQADPKNPYIWSSLAQTYLRLKMPVQASAAARTAEQTGASNPLIHHALAMFYSETGQLRHAAELEQKFAQSPKADRDALARAATLYLSAGDAQAAVTLAQQSVSQSSSPEKENLLGRALMAANQKQEGEKHLQLAWEGAKTDERIAFDYTQALLQRQDFTRAADVIDSALSAHSQDPQLTLALGVVRYGQRRFDDAITAFLKVIELNPEVEQPYLFIGRMLEQAGEHLPEITKAYESWAAREPQNPKAQLLLAKALLTQDHRSDRAQALLQKSIALDGNDWEAHYQLGTALADRRDWKAAAAELNRSVELNPKQPLPHYHLARVYDRLGQGERAEAERAIHQQLTANQKAEPQTH